MTDKQFLSFDSIFPQAEYAKPVSKEETIKLANKVAEALRAEKEKLVREKARTTLFGSGIFSSTS